MTLTYYSGAGNTFLLADNRAGCFEIQKLLGSIGEADGVILVEKGKLSDASMRIFNRDGSEAEMCGNGLRCLIHFLRELGVERQRYEIETVAGKHEGWFVEEEVCILMAPPYDLRLHVAKNLHFVNTGVPHAISFVENLEGVDVMSEGHKTRHSPLFAPAGANANFASINPDGYVLVRTYERGVEGETLACGTGACATALIAHKIHHLPSPITVQVRSQEKIKVSFDKNWSYVTIQGPVRILKEKTKSPIMFAK